MKNKPQTLSGKKEKIIFRTRNLYPQPKVSTLWTDCSVVWQPVELKANTC